VAITDLGLGFTISAKDEASSAMSKVEHGFDKMEKAADHAGQGIGEAMARLKMGVMELAIEGGPLGGLFKMAEKAAEFSDTIEHAGLRTGMTEHQMEKMRDVALDAALKGTAVSALEAGETMETFTKWGLNANDAMTALQPALALASVSFGKLSKPEAAKTLAMLMRQFKIGADEAGITVDKMTVGMQAFKVPVEEIPELLRGVGLGAQAAKASFDDTLITLGLTRAGVPETSQAIRSVNMAMMQLASPGMHKRMQAAFNVPLEAGGKMRPVIDVLGDIAKKTAGLSEAKLAENMSKVFGPRGVGGMSVIMDTLRKGITTTTGETVKGAEAIDYYRQMMEHSGGAAEGMRKKLREDFDVQVRNVTTKLSTLVSIVGQPLEKIFLPILKQIAAGLAKVGQFIREIPEPIKDVTAKAAILVGTLLALDGIFKILAAVMPMVTAGLGGIALTMGKVMLVGGPLILLGAALYFAWKKNLGGVGDSVTEMFGKVKLAFSALSQLVSRGWIDEKTFKSLTSDENAGVLGFVRKVWLWGNRIKNFLSGMWDAFLSATEKLEPVFARLGEAWNVLAGAFGLKAANDVKANAAAFDQFGAAGSKTGSILASIAGVGAKSLTIAFEQLAGFVTTLRAEWPEMKRAFLEGVGAFKILAGVITEVKSALGLTRDETKQSGEWWETFGGIIAKVASSVATSTTRMLAPIRMFLTAIKSVVLAAAYWFGNLIDMFKGVGEFFAGAFTGNWVRAWAGFKSIIVSAVRGIMGVLLSLVEGSLSVLKVPLNIIGKGHLVEGWQKSVTELRGSFRAGERERIEPGAVGPMSIAQPLTPEGPTSMPFASSTEGISTEAIAAMSNQSHADLQALLVEIRKREAMNVSLMLDREKVGAAQASWQREEEVSSFAPNVSLASGY